MHNRDILGGPAAAVGFLPKTVTPRHYDVTIATNFEDSTYKGHVTIDFEAVEDTDKIVLNSLEVKIGEVSFVTDNSPTTISPSDVSLDADAQTATFHLKKSITAGTKAQLKIDFSSTLNDHLAGFYRASYTGRDGSKKYMATTQMEPTDCRRAFPCFDEPAMKATFRMTLVADKELTCLSNMDVSHEKVVEGGKKAVTFNTTPPMSTYLLAFIIGELNCVESKDFRIPVKVWAPPDQEIERGRFSVDLAARTLEFYEKKFDSPYPLPKMDMVAVPDFAAGAMENWGLVTYRTVDLLYDEKTSGAGTKMRVAETVQHELAHQWFGNLVTMDFWEGLWLNEGFATWMSWYSSNAFYPEWKVWQRYVTDDLQSALSLDSLRSSHPIEVPIKAPDDINQIFDSISYAKGSCVLRMISKFLGEETFLEGIRRYLKKHAYGNTRTEDLWDSLSDASGKDVQNAMQIWTKQVGHPVVTVTEDASKNSLHIKQNRFLRTGDVKPDEDETLYPVFLGMRTDKGVNEETTLLERESTYKLPDLDFYKINADQSGLYRTFYSSSRLQKLGEDAKAGRLTVEDRAGLIADAGALSSSGYQASSGTLSLLKGFEGEKEHIVWDELLGWLGSLRGAWVFEDEVTKDALKAFQRTIASPKAHELGWTFNESDGTILQQFKALMFSSAGMAGDEKIIQAAKDMFRRFLDGDRNAIHPNIRGGVYALVLQNGGGKEAYEKLWKEYKTADTSDERNTALRSLGRAREPELIKRTVEITLSDEVRNQDIYMPLAGLRGHKDGINAVFEMIKTHWHALEKRLPPGLGMLGSVVSICTSGFTKEEQLHEVEAFFKDRNTKGFDQGLAQSLDSIRVKMQWVKRDKSDVETWLRKEGYLK